MPLRLLAPLACLLLLVVGCRPGATPVERARETGTLIIGNGAEPQDLDPQTSSAYTDYNILIALLEGLTVIDEASSQPVPGIASGWDISDDGLRYTFHLRPEAKWSNRAPVTAGDFVFSFQRILTPALASDYGYMLHPIRNAEAYNNGALDDFSEVGVKALDDHTLQIDLERPTPQLLALAAHQAWFPVHPPTVLAAGPIDRRGGGWTAPGKFVGNGAYQLAEWTPNQRIVVTRNPHYWNHAATADGVSRVVFIPNDNLAADEAAFRTGQLHLTYDLLPDRIAHYRVESPELLRIDPLLETNFIRFNVRRPPLDDARVRRALALAIDREAICRRLLQDSRIPARALTPPGTAGYTARAAIPDDAETARRLLAEAGYPGGEGFPILEVQMNSDTLNDRVYAAIQAMWKQTLGIDVRLVSLDFRVYLENQRAGAYDISRSRWIGDYNDPNTFLDMFVTGGGNNQTGWTCPDYDRHITAAAKSASPAERYKHFQTAEEHLLETAPIAPLYHGTRTYLIHPDVQNWVPSLLGIHRYQTIKLEAGPVEAPRD
ncbi:MAG: peptide ABC transporter substrate-binding protein [Verrucomicrobiota bacterium]